MIYHFGYPSTPAAAEGEHIMHCGLAVITAVVLHDAIVKACGWLGYWLNLGY